MAVEPGDRRQRPALDLDDRYPQPRCVQNELLEGVASLRDDEESVSDTTRGEDLLDRTAPGHELLVGTQELG
jgi:hypothetical protein